MKVQTLKQQEKNAPASRPTNQREEQLLAPAPTPNTQPAFDDGRARISARAYELYLERGQREGYAEQDWLDAEREILFLRGGQSGHDAPTESNPCM